MATSHFGPPIDLSDLPTYALVDLRPRRSVFVGRVSTKDNQNPATSIPRQVKSASASLEPGEEFIAYYWDVESGMLPPAMRGLGPQAMYDALKVPVRRDGGLQDLMDRADFLGVTRVVAESSSRVARVMHASLTVEHVLEAIGIEVVYADEPIGGTKSGRLRARRGAQVEAELYRAILMEQSMGGQIQHAIAGWNHGKPPYPYVAVIDESAPVRAPGRMGADRPKRRLAPHPDPRRFDAARKLHDLRREEHLGAGDIVTILASEPDRYPPGEGGRWTCGLVEGLLANPKLAGFQVYNRKASRTGREGHSRKNPITDWVWSPQPTHEEVVSLEEWKAAQEVTVGLRARSDEAGALARIRAVARQLGFTVTPILEGDSHTVYRIGPRKVVLPTRIPNAVVQQVVDDLRSAA